MDAPLDQGSGDPEPVEAVLALPGRDPTVEEVDDHLDVLVVTVVGRSGVEHIEEDTTVHARADVVGAGEQWNPPVGQLGDDVDLVPRPARLLGRDDRERARLVPTEVVLLVGERPQRRAVGLGVGDRARATLERDDRSGHGESTVEDPGRLGLGEHGRLIGEDVGVVGAEVVEVEELLVEEARRPREREEGRCADLAHETRGPGELVPPLATAERASFLLRDPVHHRIPDRTRELHEVTVVRSELDDGVEVRRLRVVLVEEGGGSVGNCERRVADRPVGRRDQRVGEQSQPVDLDRLAVAGLEEVPEADRLQRAAMIRRREVGEDDDGVLAHVVAEERDVEVIVVRVGHVEVVG